MENLDKVALFNIAIELDLPNLLNFCQSSKKINNLICKRNEIWNYKLKEFPEKIEFEKYNFSDKELYILLYNLKSLKEKLKLSESLFDLYNLEKLNFIFKEEIPKEIFKLINLKELNLGFGQIKALPKELGNLVNLERLTLTNNQIIKIPKEIKKLPNLKILEI